MNLKKLRKKVTRKEKKDFAERFTHKKQEFYISVLDYTGGTWIGKSRTYHFDLTGFKSDTETFIGKSFIMIQGDDSVDVLNQLKEIENKIIKIHGFRRRPEVDFSCPGIGVDEILEIGVTDEDMEQSLAEFKKEVFIEDEILGKLVLNKKYNDYEVQLSYHDKKIRLSIENKKGIEDKISKIRIIYQDIDHYVEKAKAKALECLYETAFDWNNGMSLEETNGHGELTKESFLSRMALNNITVSENNIFYSFDDGFIFFGHVIIVEGALDGSMETADFHG